MADEVDRLFAGCGRLRSRQCRGKSGDSVSLFAELSLASGIFLTLHSEIDSSMKRDPSTPDSMPFLNRRPNVIVMIRH